MAMMRGTDPGYADIQKGEAEEVRDAALIREQGRKYDQDKPNVDLVLGDFSEALLAVSEVGTLGAAKYDDHNWLKVEKGINRYSSAMLRHYLQSKQENYDNDSDCLHLAHMAWNALAVLQLRLLENNKA